MTFDEYVFIASIRVRRNPMERIGQAFYNALRYEADRTDLEACIWGGPMDCFNTDHRVPTLLAWAREHWDDDKETE